MLKFVNAHINTQDRWLLLVLVSCLLIRLLTLEYVDLIDPTETRYATIAQHMIISGDWITPRLPTANGMELYFSKPPLHYWLTALSYKLFGIDEWTARLPSFFGMLLMIGSVIVFVKKFWDQRTAYLAGCIVATSPMIFFIGGSSTIDVTFAAFTSMALVAYALLVSSEDKQRLYSGLFFLGLALAFLTKGPAAMILVGLPIFLFTCFQRSVIGIRKLRSVTGGIIFTTVVAPWFYLVEQANPGSVWYFFYNENLMRYLVHEYGGKYGEGHYHAYGAIWWMTILSMAPWSLFLIFNFGRRIKSASFAKIRNLDPWMMYALIWGLSSSIFFTFARQLLPAYTIPGIPGLAIFLAVQIYQQDSFAHTTEALASWWKKLIFVSPQRTLYWSSGMSVFLLLLVLIAGNTAGERKSAEKILEHIAVKSIEPEPIVGVTSFYNLSPFWTSLAWEEELSKKVHVKYVNLDQIKAGLIPNIIVREQTGTYDPGLLEHSYNKFKQIGRWAWYRKKV